MDPKLGCKASKAKRDKVYKGEMCEISCVHLTSLWKVDLKLGCLAGPCCCSRQERNSS